MPLFVSDEEMSRLSNDAVALAAKADAYIRDLQSELDTVKARADAASITAEQTCSLLEQKFISLTEDYSKLESEHAQLKISLDERVKELAQFHAEKHQLHLQSIGKDGDIERLSTEVSELHKSRRQLMEMVEQKDLVISEKNATVKTYLDKIINLTDNAAKKEARLAQIEAELVRSQATCTRLSQEKELIETHNLWLNEELTSKVNSLVELRRTHADFEADMSAKLSDVNRQSSECSSSLNWYKERVRELEINLTSLQEEFCSSKNAAALNQERLLAEISTVNKLVELYKESSEEWSRKAGELEGVIKALETHLTQVENDYKEKLEKEVSARKHSEKEAAELKEKLEKCEAEIESSRKANELSLLPLSSFRSEAWKESSDANEFSEDSHSLVPKIPVGVSGTALAASLLRDGWSLAKMYAKYQEAVDALRHEQLGRRESEAVLQRVLYELEQKAGVILDERAEYERMAEAYTVINQKLQNSVSEQSSLEKTIQELKADLRRRERDYNLAQKEINDLQKQVTVLLKECRDIQLRCGSSRHDYAEESTAVAAVEVTLNGESDAEKVISDRLLTFKDINGLVEQNVQLRSLVRSLTDQFDSREMEFKEKFELELKKHTDEAASKVAAVLQRAEEQGRMIESLHTSVAMYKRLYDEEHKLHSSHAQSVDAAPVDGRRDLLLLLEGSQEATKKAQEKAAERVRYVEEDLEKSRSEIISLRSERDKLALEAKFAREKLDSILKEAEHQKLEINGVLARNVEFSQLIVDYQRKLRESLESLNAAEELSRKLNMEVSILKHEKDVLSNAEKRACEEVRSLSERVYRLQASLDTVQSAEEAREEARSTERRKLEEYIIKVEREWAEAKKELQEERNNVRTLTSDREQNLKNAVKQVEEMGKELANALHAVTAAETRAAVAEARLSDLEKRMKSSDAKVGEVDDGSRSTLSTTEEVVELHRAKEELEKLKEEAQANKDHMLQYKSIAQVNEDALKQMEFAHENFKAEAEKLKKSLEAEVLSLRERVSELEKENIMKSEQVASAAAVKEDALASSLAEITGLKEEISVKISQITAMEVQISALKKNLEEEHDRWRCAQANYERQVILQSETIQELTKTSQALASLQDEASELHKLADACKAENSELKGKWEGEKSVLEESKNKAEKKLNEVNEQNKILHSRLEALHIQLAEKDRSSAGISSGSTGTDPLGDSGLQNVVSYLRRSKEIAETEISLLKQEKLRLQTQLESALKAADNAQASLTAERANSRALLLTEEEIKSLQLQVREMNLLRESNMQLREENKHNFEECHKLRDITQKARADCDNLDNQLKERQIEIEACKKELEASKKEIEMLRMEKENLEKRVCERCRNFDVDDYNRLKIDIRQIEEKLKGKDTEIEEMKTLGSRRQETIMQLEQQLASSRVELNEKEKRLHDILQAEAVRKLELEKQKRIIAQLKRKYDILSKEKEEMTKENQALSKQLDELKQSKKSMVDAIGDQVMKEKEEKDTRIQILEKTVERQREELKKEKDDYQKEKERRQKGEKAIWDSAKNADQLKTKISSELEQHKQAVKRLADELQKIKNAEANLPEGTLVVQHLSGTILDDHASSYLLAVENFERVARTVFSELGSGVLPLDTSLVSDAPTAATAVATQALIPSSSAGTAPGHIPAKAMDGKERLVLAKINVETRKQGRKLVRPRLGKPEEAQGDVEMSEVEGSNVIGKVASSQDVETQVSLTQQSQPLVRKRMASSTPELREESSLQGEPSTDIIAPVLKRSKGTDSALEDAVGQSAIPVENVDAQPVIEESIDAVGDIPQEEGVDAEKEEVDATGEKTEELKESQQVEGTSEAEIQDDKNNASEENLEKAIGAEMAADEVPKDQTEQENQQLTIESESEREEGELLPDVADPEGVADISNVVGSPETEEVQPEVIGTPVVSPTRVEDEGTIVAAAETGDVTSPEVANDEKNEEGDVSEENVEGSDKSNDGNDHVAIETDQVPEAASVISETASTSWGAEPEASSKQLSTSTTTTAEVKQASPVNNAPNIVNLRERARERAIQRQAGVVPPSVSRGRGRTVARGRGVRGGRGGRGQTPGQQ
ncbi:nuclear-pore anchor isoform X3 [Mangifera indica]|uniref:nuclear-pore anchor isoform X3 n=1 Tax=Mangifera indica TaxID=29780 RepID=UPI001CF9E9B7|nr:nuclear-pore anchor isoform X3 [Mangifera indica]